MPISPFGPVQLIIGLILGGILVLVLRHYNRTSKQVMRYTLGGAAGAIIGILASYILALAVSPILTRGADYRFMFWGLFVGGSLIFIIVGALGSLIVTKKIESKMSGEDKDKGEKK